MMKSGFAEILYIFKRVKIWRACIMTGPINSSNQAAYSGNAQLNSLSDEQLKEQRDNNGGANIKNTTTGEGDNAVKKFSVFATADGDTDSKVDRSEAQKGFSSIFSAAQGELDQGKLINDAVSKSTRLSSDLQQNAASVVQKYLSGTSIAGLINSWSGFSTIQYTAVEVDNTYEATGTEKDTGVQTQIDETIKAQVQSQVETLTNNIESQYNDALTRALAQAENELVGDADIVGKFNPEVKNKSGITSGQLSSIQYNRSSDDGENTNVATYESSRGTGNASAGYTTTVSYLKANGAKAETKLVNGQEQTVYKVKIDGQTEYVTVDDAGQVHTMQRDKGFLRSSKFTTDDSIADAKYQANNDGIEGNDFDPSTATNVKVKVRNVDGQNQSVMTWKDADGNKHSRVIDYNDAAGLTSSLDVHQVNAAGTRAKYSSETSGLGAWVAADDNGDNIRQYNDKNHMVQDAVHHNEDGTTTTGHVRTHRGRMKIDAQNVGVAIDNMADQVISSGGTVSMSDPNTTIIELNGHKYKLDATDYKAADKTMRFIQSELNAMKGRGDDEGTQETIEVDTSEIKFTDNRQSTNWGVDHNTLTSSNTKINTITYGSGLSRAQFASQGWKASAGRADEKAVIALMNNYMAPATTEGGNPTVTTDVTGMTTAEEFATRFLKVALSKDNKFVTSGVSGKSFENFNVEKLAAAIKTANPSFFDADGNMFKDCDFNRINLPRKLDAYLNN